MPGYARLHQIMSVYVGWVGHGAQQQRQVNGGWGGAGVKEMEGDKGHGEKVGEW